MTTEDRKITQPVEIKNDSDSRVAYDLMDHISRHEVNVDAEKKTREYWLTLYHQCRTAARGAALQHILERK